ncbi:MAG: hypothetical protein J6U10_01185, partial [Lachnospiraceae bacterium]|nr:hypothetical protein [Lachnospiraceae bacterium]
TRDSYGAVRSEVKGILPLLGGCNPLDEGAGYIKPGDSVAFTVKTRGNLTSKALVRVRPSFKTAEGAALDMYYRETLPNGKAVYTKFDKTLSALPGPLGFETVHSGVFDIPETAFFVPAGQVHNGISPEAGRYTGIVCVHFDIAATDPAGKVLMTYENKANAEKGFCNMWELEGAKKSAEDNKGNTFVPDHGDVFFIDTGKKKTRYVTKILY